MADDLKKLDQDEDALRALAEKEKREGVVDQQTAAEGTSDKD